MMELFNLLIDFSSAIGYWGIVLLMAIESSFIPFPSEIVIPPAAYLAALGEMDIFLVILSGVAGSLIGALFNYYLALTLGRKVIFALADSKLAKYFLIDKGKIEKAEEYFLRYGNLSTLIGRLVPAIRQLISIPAGFSRMNLRNFLLFTTLGSSLWITILAILGYVFGANKDILEKYYANLKIFGILLAFGLAAFLLIKTKRATKPSITKD